MKTIARMATYPGRAKSLPIAVNSILHQVDHLQVYCNEYQSPPACLNHPKISPVLGENIGDTGKIYGEFQGIILLVDDDISYPQDYVSYMVGKLKQYHHKAIVGCHGAILIPPVNNYFKDRQVIHFRDMTIRDAGVHVLGTGVLAYHSDYFSMDSGDIEEHNMLDIHFAVSAQRQEKSMIAVRKKSNWIKPIPTQDSLWARRGTGDAHTRHINSIPKWNLY